MSSALDQTRYFLLREVPFGQDGDFSRSALVTRINADLANNLGNLAQRVLSQVQRNCGGISPEILVETETDSALLARARALLPLLRDAMERTQLHVVLDLIWEVINEANRYIDREAPWALKKTDPDRMRTVLAVLVEVIRITGILVQPIMPASGAKILDQLAVADDARDFAALSSGSAAGLALPAPSGVFPRVDPAAALTV